MSEYKTFSNKTEYDKFADELATDFRRVIDMLECKDDGKIACHILPLDHPSINERKAEEVANKINANIKKDGGIEVNLGIFDVDIIQVLLLLNSKHGIALRKLFNNREDYIYP